MLLEKGIDEYNFSHPPLNDDEEEKEGSNIGGHNQNPRSNSQPPHGRGGKLRGSSKCSREMSTNTPNQPSVLVLTPIAPEEAPGIVPGTSQKEDPPTPIRIGPEIGEGALRLSS